MYFKAMEGKFRNCIVRFGEVVFWDSKWLVMYVRKGAGGNKKQVLLRNRVATKALVLAVCCVLVGTQ